MKILRYFISCFALLLFTVNILYAQSQVPTEEEIPVIQNHDAGTEKSRRESLISIIQSEQKVRESLAKIYSKEERSEADVREIADLEERLLGLQHNFSEISTGVDLNIIVHEQSVETMDWSKELLQLLQPLLNEIRRVTSKPREIDHIRTTIEDLKLKIATSNVALDNLQKLANVTEQKILLEKLTAEELKWKNQLQQLDTQLSINEQKLAQRLSERKSVFETVESLPDLFFKSRGRNFILAILTVLFFWIGVNYAWRVLQKKGPLHPDQKTIKARIFYVSYLFFRGIGSFFIFVVALFILGDWVLLILAVLLALGIIWTSKQLMLRFWTQTTILLNMGAVREGERVEYMNLPWKVRTLNFYSMLENPALDSGMIRIPLKDLEDMRSRKYGEHEPWFPTHNGDWVILDDGVYGKVIWQGINNVRLKELGGSVKTYSTSSFTALNPISLTPGFRVKISFGVDYSLQEISTGKIPEIFKSEIEAALLSSGHKDDYSLQVEFEEAAASSLNYAIIADFNGDLASRYQSLKRQLSRICVDACNKHGWVIPFQQVTVHMTKNDT